MNESEIKILVKVRNQCNDILAIINNWDLSHAGTYLSVANYIEELVPYIKTLHKIAKKSISLHC